MPTSLNVYSGEYSINGGSWSDVPTTIEGGDLVRVRHVTDSGYSLSKVTILNIGGVSGNFISTTVPTGVDPNNYNDLTYYIYPSQTQPGNTALQAFLTYGLKLPTDPVTVVERMYLNVSYEDFGGVSELRRAVTFNNGSTDDGVVVSINPESVISGFLETEVLTGDIRTCSDDVDRVVRVFTQAILETPE